MEPIHPTIKGRGTATNPTSRFEALAFAGDGDAEPDPYGEGSSVQTQFFRDHSKSIIARNDSPDIPFTQSINPYRGCEHGCVYCFARNGHNYLGLSAGLDFETKIFVKPDAAELLRDELSAHRYVPDTISISGVTDCYQPVEKRLRITRRCLEVLLTFRHPLAMVTKNHLITRDADLLAELAKFDCAMAFISITTLDPALGGKLEPRASSPARRLEAVRTLAQAGVPVGVMVAPVIPGLTDHEIPAILSAAASAGARTAAFTPLRLPWDVAPLFADWLARHFPDRKDKVLNRVRSMRGGKLNDPNFGTRMKASGVFADQIREMFRMAKKRAGLDGPFPSLTTQHFRRPTAQLTLFE